MRLESKKAWLACAIDSEGTIQVSKQSSVNMKTAAYGLRIIIYNSDEAYINQCLSFIDAISATVSRVSCRRTSRISTKDVAEIRIQTLGSVIAVLKAVIPFLTAKKALATAVLGLALMRKSSRGDTGERAPWTKEELEQAVYIRKTFMLYSKRANGETLPASELRAIPSEASGSEISTEEPLETRAASIASSIQPQERPAPLEGDDVVRTTAKVVKLG